MRPGPTPSKGLLEQMIFALHHRGPDDTGFYSDSSVGLAHARLSIIDISGGRQPIYNENRSVVVVFNGEIFNYPELRRILQSRGHRFYTHSDTEAIVHAYEEYGDKFVDHLNGQFAIALWDNKQQRLVLARDRTGIRPVFYTMKNGKLYFASEIKSIFVCPDVPRQISPSSLGQIFTYWAPLQPATAFEGIASIPPGHLAVIENGEIKVRRYWDWSFPETPSRAIRPEEDYAEELRALLTDSVRLQVRSDVPVGAYLSGGLDSSIITALIKSETDVDLRTFSLSFDDSEFDESEYQQQLVTHLGTRHTEFRCASTDIEAVFPRTIWHSETPILRTAPAPMMLLSGAVRSSGYKVVLTGEGADEVFGGYDIFKEAKIRRFCARAPDSKWRSAILRSP